MITASGNMDMNAPNKELKGLINIKRYRKKFVLWFWYCYILFYKILYSDSKLIPPLPLAGVEHAYQVYKYES